MKHRYKSDIILGEKYRDEQTGYEGVATAIFFFQHACERVCIETYDKKTKKVISETFDSPRLTHIATNKTATSDRPGGPSRGEGARQDPVR